MDTRNHPFIRRLRVEGGYLDGLDLDFAPGGNVIIGEPGTGKSTLLTLLRFVLALPVPDKKRQEHDALLAANLGAGRVHVTLSTPYAGELAFSRAGGDDAPRLDAASGAARDARLTPELFPVCFVGHGELQIMAVDGLLRRALLAGIAGDDLAALEDEVRAARRALDENAATIVRLDGEIEALAEQTKALSGERGRLEELRRVGGGSADLAAATQRKTLRERERMMVDAATREVDRVEAEIGRVAPALARRLGQCVDPEALRGENADVTSAVAEDVRALAGAVERMAAEVLRLAEGARGAFAERARTLATRHAADDDAYRALLARHERDAGRAFERLKLERSVAVLAKSREEHDARVHDRAQALAARDRLRARLDDLLLRRRAILHAACARVTEALANRVEVTLEEEAERSTYAALLKDLLKGKRFEADDLDRLARAMTPHDLFACAVGGDAARIASKMEMKTLAFAHRFVGALLESPRRYALETVEVHDVPAVALKHGDGYKPSHEQSSGQRTVSFLSLLLFDRPGPFIADQPEDNVGNPYLAKELCRIIAEGQERGQFVIVTHNVNLPILGRAQKVVKLCADGLRGWVEVLGPPEAVLAPMEEVLEGGRRALVTRKEFYGV